MTDKKLKALIKTIPKYKKGDKVWVIHCIHHYENKRPKQLKIIKIDEIKFFPLLVITYFTKFNRKTLHYNEEVYYNEKELFKTQKEAQKKCDKINKKNKEENIKNLKKRIKNDTKELVKITK